MKEKPNLFFDWDDTIMVSRPLTIAYLEKRYGVHISYEEFNHGNVNSLDKFLNSKKPELKLSPSEVYLDYAKNFWWAFDGVRSLHFLPYSIEVIKSLSEYYNLWIVTSRQEIEKVFIQEVIDKYFFNCFSGVHCVWKNVYGLGVSKVDFIRNTEGEKIAFVDDSVSEVLKVSSVLISYLFDPRKESSNKGVKKVSSWLEIGNMLLK